MRGAPLAAAVGTLLWWTPVALAVNDMVVGTAVISGTSMTPTLNPGALATPQAAAPTATLHSHMLLRARSHMQYIQSSIGPQCSATV